jgi:transposase
MNIDFQNVTDITATEEGAMNIIAGITKKINLAKVFDEHLTQDKGRKPEVPYGKQAEIMIATIATGYSPLYRLSDKFKDVDIEGIFDEKIDVTKLTDDRFGKFLDHFHGAEPKKIFSLVSTTILKEYGIKITTINYDTTSKIMWGEYETSEGTMGVIDITFGHSKQKRPDKNQIKMGIGTANGIIVDADVLSGNKDDKTYNLDKIKEIDELLERTETNKENFYYVADSAAFTKQTIQEADARNIKLISRIPDSYKLAKTHLDVALRYESEWRTITLTKNNKTNTYKIIDFQDKEYQGVNCNIVVCYSEALRKTKETTLNKAVIKEKGKITKDLKKYKRRQFACLEDAKKEIQEYNKKELRKNKYHTVDFTINEINKRKRGRPTTIETESQNIEILYEIEGLIKEETTIIENELKKNCMFLLASTDIKMMGEEILTEYKTQGTVEKKFQQLKSPQFVSSLYLTEPKRIEALSYMMLMTLMILSVMEHVVRREMQKEELEIIGPGKIKMKSPSLVAILRLFEKMLIQTITYKDGQKIKKLQRTLTDSQKIILKCLNLTNEIYETIEI